MNKDLLRFDKDKLLVFFDTETLNLCLNFCHNLPWQISMLKVENGKEVEFRDIYVKWKTDLKISKEAAIITKYNEKTVEDKGVSPEEAIEQICPWFEQADYIVGHNIIGFDIYIMKEFYELMNKPWRHLLTKFIDTNCLAKAIKLDMSLNGDSFISFQFKMYHLKKKGIKTNLKALGHEFNIEHDYENLHNALNDLRLNLKVYNQLKYQIEL